MDKKISIVFPFFLIMYELAVNLSNDMYIPAVSHMMQFFDSDSYTIQLTLTAWFAGAMMMNPLLGILSDHVGRKKILLMSGVLFLIATLYCSFPTNIYPFLAARFVQGLTVTSIVVCGYALVHELYDDKQAIMLIAWMSGALIVAPMLGPLLGGYIIYLLGWHYIFLGLFFIAMMSLIGLYYSMPKLVNINQGTPISIKKEFSIYKMILLNKKFMLGSLLYSVLYAGLIAWIAASPFLIIVKEQYTPLQFGMMQIPIFASYILGIFILRLALNWNISEEKIILFGMSVFSLLVIATPFFENINLLFIIIFMSIYSCSYGLIASPLNRITVKSLDVGMGKIMAMFDLMMGLFATIATIIINSQADNLLERMVYILLSIMIAAIIFYIIKFHIIMRINHEKSFVS